MTTKTKTETKPETKTETQQGNAKMNDTNANAQRPAKVKPLKKISAKSLCPQIKQIIRGLMREEEPSLDPIYIGRIMGVARKADIITNEQYGDSWKFSGEFQGYTIDGTRVIASVCYLPDVIADPLAESVNSGGQSIEFGCDLFIRYDETSTTNYVYEVEMLTDVAPSDPLKALESTMPPLLTAPAH